jgi:hypothetical protein
MGILDRGCYINSVDKEDDEERELLESSSGSDSYSESDSGRRLIKSLKYYWPEGSS